MFLSETQWVRLLNGFARRFRQMKHYGFELPDIVLYHNLTSLPIYTIVCLSLHAAFHFCVMDIDRNLLTNYLQHTSHVLTLCVTSVLPMHKKHISLHIPRDIRSKMEENISFPWFACYIQRNLDFYTKSPNGQALTNVSIWWLICRQVKRYNYLTLYCHIYRFITKL